MGAAHVTLAYVCHVVRVAPKKGSAILSGQVKEHRSA